MIIGTAGHIDHGKTALVRALTGVDTDRLKEEKARGISIDLGFAYMRTPRGSTVGFVDVPGHERFIHNMLAGVMGIDFVIVVVAANEGIKPQTEEHLAILDLLGVSRGLVALTKTDIADEAQRERVSSEIRRRLSGTTLSSIPIVPVSSSTGNGLDILRETIVEASEKFVQLETRGRFRLAVDRCFTLTGIGTVVTGTILSGSISVGDSVVVSPRGIKAHVRSIHAQNSRSEIGQTGDRCALNLVGAGVSKEAIFRGDVVMDPTLHAPADRIDAYLQLLGGERRPLSQWTPVKLHVGALEVNARVVVLADKDLSAGEDGFVQFVLDRPIAAAVWDRFIVRDVSGQRTMGGGRLVDLRAPARKRRTPPRIAQLHHFFAGSVQDTLNGLLDSAPFYVDITSFGRDRALAQSDIDAFSRELSLLALTVHGRALALSSGHAEKLKSSTLAALDKYHRDYPDLLGIGFEQLRLRVEPRLPAPMFHEFLQILIRGRHVVLDGTWIRLASHSLKLAISDEKTWKKIYPMLTETQKFRPPKTRDLVEVLGMTENDIRRLLKTLAKMGKVHEISHDHFFSCSAVIEVLDIVADIAKTDGGHIATAALRDRLENGRKISIELLEFFDRHGITIRRGDFRILNQPRLDIFRAGISKRVAAG